MNSSTASMSILDILSGWAARFESTLESMLKPGADVPEVLAEAMRYSVLEGGKRVRAFIVTRGCELCGGRADMAAPAAVALECVHAFSLVHDDLPAMDNDDLRRGRPTCHKAFGEAVAILAGDGLLTLAFEILATRMPDPARAAAAVAELARGTGWAGMIAGQTRDILGERQPPDLALTREIHRQKTARLFEAAGRLGAISAGADEARNGGLAAYGQHLGRAFQIADDLLDLTGTPEQMGKAVTKDADAGKQTYPAAIGVVASREVAQEAATAANAALDIFGPAADDLRALARFVVDRRK